MSSDPFRELDRQIEEMRRQSQEMLDEVRRWQEDFSWSDWEPHTVGILPIRVNGRWYFKGDRVFRKEKMRYLTGSKQYKYGDEFDVLKDTKNNIEDPPGYWGG